MRLARTLLFSLFEDALRLEMIVRNPVAPVRLKLPPKRPPGRTLQPEEARALLAALDEGEPPSPWPFASCSPAACGGVKRWACNGGMWTWSGAFCTCAGRG